MGSQHAASPATDGGAPSPDGWARPGLFTSCLERLMSKEEDGRSLPHLVLASILMEAERTATEAKRVPNVDFNLSGRIIGKLQRNKN